ncbi:hypothetical protein GCM10009689_28810 [Brevibacterium antiquum]|uniref:hypothetical protein n=1 Tax=Brevibacterium antiquum TaxID=234835 RepID=UPI0018DEF4EB|nr:hypothetical protein [Brevibacterium antiquum]
MRELQPPEGIGSRDKILRAAATMLGGVTPARLATARTLTIAPGTFINGLSIAQALPSDDTHLPTEIDALYAVADWVLSQ